jgi:hypothetical protein
MENCQHSLLFENLQNTSSPGLHAHLQNFEIIRFGDDIIRFPHFGQYILVLFWRREKN